jgi:16S rRNA (guanine527-N7)-methyltransferase
VLKQKLEKQNLQFDDLFYERCDQFKQLLQKWGKVHSFTTQLSDEDIETNIIDSVYPLGFIDSFKSFADIGTGAGYPGMLLAIARPQIKCYLIEPRQKRVAFLNFVKNSLGLKNVIVVQDRVENCQDIEVDLVTSRAVTDTKFLIELTKNIVCDETSFLFYKGSLCEEEIESSNIKENVKVVSVGDHRNYLYFKGEK